jgi:cytochrome c oxidase subunit 4
MSSSQPADHAPATPGHDAEHGEGEVHVHIVKPWMLLLVFVVLLFLTFLTVGVTWIDFGRTINVWVALLIAAAKGALVVLFFMHLRWDSPFNGLVFVSALFFVALFIGITVLDTKEALVNYTLPTNSAARPIAQ